MSKTILITGASSGFGRDTAETLHRAGHTVYASMRGAQGKNREAAEALGKLGIKTVELDVNDDASVEAGVKEVLAEAGKIDVLVNNAGLNIKARAFRELTAESYHQLLAANLHGAFYCMQAVVPQMRQRRDGLIVCVNSISGKRSGPLGGIAYNAAKFGLRGLAMGLGAEEKDNGIRVCSIYPGEVNTPILDHRPVPLSPERLQAMLQPEDVAAAILFVATLPPRANVPELVITPANATYV
jgi:NAD(P)-dependent dehydrogenase (short-subunit alcohol dehydrogenase family)